MQGYIYKVTNLINKKIYIGKKVSSEFNPKYFGSGSVIRAAILYYGQENFIVEIIEEVLNKLDLNDREIYWIDFYNSTNPDIGYNISKGGQKNDFLSANTAVEIINEEIQTILNYRRAHPKRKGIKRKSIIKAKQEEKNQINNVNKNTIEIQIPNFSFSISKDFMITKY